MSQPKVWIFGAAGRLGAALCRKWNGRFEIHPLTRSDIDLNDLVALQNLLRAGEYDAVVNCAAQANVDRCETEREEAMRLNADVPDIMARICEEKSARFIHISTDYVFDGQKESPYTEDDPAHPLSVYGESKLAGEQAVMNAGIRHVIARVSWLFGPDKPSFIDAIIARAQKEDHVEAIGDKTSCPTYSEDVANWLAPFVENADLPGGIYHACNSGGCTWRDYGEYGIQCAAEAGLPLRTTSVGSLPLEEMKNFIATRPRHTVMDNSKLARVLSHPIRPWQEAVREFIRRKISAA